MQNFGTSYIYNLIKLLFLKQNENLAEEVSLFHIFPNYISFFSYEAPRTFYDEMILRVYFSVAHFNLIFFVLFALALSFLMIGLSYLLAEQKPDLEKNSGYECGFDPFSDARDPFHIRFYLLSILFIIFDIEIVFFFPWAVSLSLMGLLGFYTMSLFVIILAIGFVYEWKKNALEWD